MIQTGDILFTRGKSILARLIQKIDDCYFNHCGVVILLEDGTPMVLESLASGATMSFLKDRIESNEDYIVMRPNVPDRVVEVAVGRVLYQVANRGKTNRYDIPLLFKIALAKLLRVKGWFKQDNKANSDICSETVRRYTNILGLAKYTQESMLKLDGREWITPNDFLKYNEGELIKVYDKENQINS